MQDSITSGIAIIIMSLFAPAGFYWLYQYALFETDEAASNLIMAVIMTVMGSVLFWFEQRRLA